MWVKIATSAVPAKRLQAPMGEDALRAQLSGAAVIAHRDALGVVADRAEHNSVALFNVDGNLCFDSYKVVVGK